MRKALDRCPTCRLLTLPPVKICANEMCRAEFYRGERGRSDAIYCSGRCKSAQVQREYRRREKAGEAQA